MTYSPPSPQDPMRIGTRGSPLALWQAHEVKRCLMGAFSLSEAAFQIVVIKVIGDQIQDRALKDIGGKGLFTREIEDALLASTIDLAVHSVKDMPTLQPDGLVLDCYLPRADVRDAFLSHRYTSLADLPKNAVVGTSSLRRRAQLLVRRPDLQVVDFRGNVQTRLHKLDSGVADATFLAMAGLMRLDMGYLARSAISPDDMLPAIAQGAIGVERRLNDLRAYNMLKTIHHHETGLRLRAERAFLARLDGSCQTPIAGLAILNGDNLILRGQILRPSGSAVISGQKTGPADHGEAIGIALADELRAQAPADFLSWSTDL